MRLRSLQGSPYTIADMSHPQPILLSEYEMRNGWFLENRSYVAYNSQSIGNTGLQKKKKWIEILNLSRRLANHRRPHRLE